MIDTVLNGDQLTYGFIAQQVDSVVQNAVRLAKEFIPNIYDLATVSHGNVLSLESKKFADGGVVASRLKLYIDANNREVIVNVIEQLDAQTVVIDRDLDHGKVFVYGQEVDDFRTINTNALLSVAVAALKKTDARCELLMAENALLRDQMDILKSKIAAIEEKIKV
jgi:hypothetical protein